MPFGPSRRAAASLLTRSASSPPLAHAHTPFLEPWAHEALRAVAGGAVEASTAAESVDSDGAPWRARLRRHTRSAEAGGARVLRIVFFPRRRVEGVRGAMMLGVRAAPRAVGLGGTSLYTILYTPVSVL